MRIVLQPLQRLIIALCFVVILLRGIYPPWIEKVYWRSGAVTESRVEGYSSLVAPPYRYIASAERSELNIDFPTLLLHWLAAAAIGGALLWAVNGAGPKVNALCVVAIATTLNLVFSAWLLLAITSSNRDISEQILWIGRNVSSIETDVGSIRGSVNLIESDVSSMRSDVTSIHINTIR
jgi:hypothetical protein